MKEAEHESIMAVVRGYAQLYGIDVEQCLRMDADGLILNLIDELEEYGPPAAGRLRSILDLLCNCIHSEIDAEVAALIDDEQLPESARSYENCPHKGTVYCPAVRLHLIAAAQHVCVLIRIGLGPKGITSSDVEEMLCAITGKNVPSDLVREEPPEFPAPENEPYAGFSDRALEFAY